MELRTLRYFLAVAHYQNISAAAQALHLTQPTLSRQLMDLEAELGAPLFVRSRRGRRLVLTEQGLLLRRRAAELLELAEQTTHELRAVEQDLAGDVYIGGGESQSLRIIARTIRALQRDCPQIRCHLFSGNAETVSERLDRGLLDFGVLIDADSRPGYHALRLPTRDTWGLIVRRDHPLAARAVITPEDLPGVPLLISRPDLLQSLSQTWSHYPPERLQVAATYTLIYNAALLVEEGVGCALALEHLVPTSPPSPLCFRPLSPRLEACLDVVWKRDVPLSRPANRFLTQLTALCHADAGEG